MTDRLIANSEQIQSPNFESVKLLHPIATMNDNSNLDGVGLWNSFTRGFATPLLAVFDLLDNSFDAAPTENGHIHIELDLDDGGNKRGITILNDCTEPIGSLTHALTLFKSSKCAASDKIGENGVGVKQGCATLSDLSFVISRDHDVFGLGIVARDLQTSNGINFPSFSFKWDETCGPLVSCFQRELESIFSPYNSNSLHGIIVKYGDGDAQKGILELTKHFMKITTGLWNSARVDHVFGVVIYDLKHGYHKQVKEGIGLKEEGEEEEENDKNIAENFLVQVEENLPKHYLHVPKSFDFQVNGCKLSFSFWQNRLCEMTQFTVQIDKVFPYSHSKDMAPHNNQYALDVYLGFDAIRGSDCDAPKTAKLFYHSRRTGRLIKEHGDARGELRLSSGGTQFCQGLTIIVDDKHGMLPLNPTKQDFAFGEESHGSTHQDNIKLWLGSVAKVYYGHHLDKCGGLKTMLTDLLKSARPKAVILENRSREEQKSMDAYHFTTFTGINWYYKPKQNTLYPKSKQISINQGSRELIQLPFPKENSARKKAPVKKTTGKKTAKKKAATKSPRSSTIKSEEVNGKKRKFDAADTAPQRKNVINAVIQKEKVKMQKVNDGLRKQLEAEEMNGYDLANKNEELATENKELKDQLHVQRARTNDEQNAALNALKVKMDESKIQLKFYKMKAKRLSEENTSLELMFNNTSSE